MSDYNSNIPDQVIDKSKGEDKVWLEATTINILPGENLGFDLSEKDAQPLQPNQDTVQMVCTVDEQGMGRAFVASFSVEEEKETSLNLFLQGDDSYGATANSYEIVKGWWSIDKAGEKPITRALPGMTVYFHIETKNIPDGEKLIMYLYDDDSDEGGTEEFLGLAHAQSNIAISDKEVTDDKVVKTIKLSNLQNRLDKEEDKLVELFFRCFYGNVEADLPAEKTEYLRIGEMVIDRYKMPGLDQKGKGIAHDMTYGFGKVVNDPIYTEDLLSKYKEEYTEFGFDEEKHGLFSNANDFELLVLDGSDEELTTPPIPYLPNFVEEPVSTSLDPIYSGQLDWEAMENWQYNNNRKNMYTKEEIFETLYIDEDINDAIDGFNEVIDNVGDTVDGLVEDAVEGVVGSANDAIEDLIDDMFFPPVSLPSIPAPTMPSTPTPDIPPFTMSTGDTIEAYFDYPDAYLKDVFQFRATQIFATRALEVNLINMINKFYSGNGGIYESSKMKSAIEKQDSTREYCMFVENYIAEKLKDYLEDLDKLEDKVPTFEGQEADRRAQGKIMGDLKTSSRGLTYTFNKPRFDESPKKVVGSWFGGFLSVGLKIALNDIWAAEVKVLELENDGENYSCKYEVILWDHFGLDKPDLEKNFNVTPYVQGMFACWFILQHFRGRKPFVSKIKLERSFKGNFTKGREDRLMEADFYTEEQLKKLNNTEE